MIKKLKFLVLSINLLMLILKFQQYNCEDKYFNNYKKNVTNHKLSDLKKNARINSIFASSLNPKIRLGQLENSGRWHKLQNTDNFISNVHSFETCNPKYTKHKIQISDNCEPFNYQFIECRGYCKSESAPFEYTDNELKSIGCCSLKRVAQRNATMLCKDEIEIEKIKNKYYEGNSILVEFLEIFKDSFTKEKWTKKLTKQSNTNFNGYYTIKIFENPECGCLYFNN